MPTTARLVKLWVGAPARTLSMIRDLGARLQRPELTHHGSPTWHVPTLEWTETTAAAEAGRFVVETTTRAASLGPWLVTVMR